MKKISNDTLKMYSDYQFKPFIAQYQPLSSLTITPIITSEIIPKPKVKHWSYLKTRELVEIEQTYHDIERSMIRKEKPKIEFEDGFHDVYDPEFSSDDDQETLSANSREYTNVPIPTVQSSKRILNIKKEGKKKTPNPKSKPTLQAFVKSLRKIKWFYLFI